MHDAWFYGGTSISVHPVCMASLKQLYIWNEMGASLCKLHMRRDWHWWRSNLLPVHDISQLGFSVLEQVIFNSQIQKFHPNRIKPSPNFPVWHNLHKLRHSCAQRLKASELWQLRHGWSPCPSCPTSRWRRSWSHWCWSGVRPQPHQTWYHKWNKPLDSSLVTMENRGLLQEIVQLIFAPGLCPVAGVR